MYEDIMYSLLKSFNKVLRSAGSHMFSGGTSYIKGKTKCSIRMPLKCLRDGTAKLLESPIPYKYVDLVGKGICKYFNNPDLKVKFCSLWGRYLDVLDIIRYCLDGVVEAEAILAVTKDNFLYPVGVEIDFSDLLNYYDEDSKSLSLSLMDKREKITKDIKLLVSDYDLKSIIFRPIDSTLDLYYTDGSLLRLSHCGKAYKIRRMSENMNIVKGVRFISLYNQIAMLVKKYEPFLLAYKCITIDLKFNKFEVRTNDGLFERKDVVNRNMEGI